ncbi:AMP-binding protein [Rhodococcus sp. G-MC3]|uniref:AMP-binding protein n=1 Tax=Rhodococcus sp. G-MC3 TaxID=3046209 RepID=UPI0024B996E5|nr:AMP-binding protein [Rhodococcus sp. G-MC3]MDJ0392675.1 AMP-binding protein [Rhodococcus sp. G-MC3]
MLNSAIDLARAILRSGILRPSGSAHLAQMGIAAARWDVTPATALAVTARRFPTRIALIDEAGPVSYRTLDNETDALARALLDQGVGREARVAILCRNHRGFLQAVVAAGRVGADQILINTSLAGTQLTDVLREQRAEVLIVDADFPDAAKLDEIELIQAWTPADGARLRPGIPTVMELIARRSQTRLPFRPRVAQCIILTSGTTGTPKGARRSVPRNPLPAAALLSRIPLRSGNVGLISAPIFHSWGFGALISSIALGSTAVLQRRFAPDDALRAIERHQVQDLYVVPIMLGRILDLPDAELSSADTSCLRTIIACGSAIPAPLVRNTLRRFGQILYNIYGSTEVSFASIATPDELAAHPATSGRAPFGTKLAILSVNGTPAARGAIGQVFVGNSMLFDGYTRPGESKQVIDGLMASGDLGRIGAGGLLFLEGRVDDMIVSGGENVYPQEVERVIAEMPGVREVAVTGVSDPEFGQRLAAFVVREDAGSDYPTAESVTAEVKGKLARFSVPRDVCFIDALPRNSTGKVVPRLLRKLD